MTFYDSTGSAVAYTEDNENIYLYNGTPVAYLFGSLVYNYKGIQLGRFENGWVRDKRGGCAFFTEYTRGSGPIKPVKHVIPVKGAKQYIPIKGIRHVASVKAIDNMTWSPFSGVQFFWQ